MTVSVLEVKYNYTGNEAELCPVVLHSGKEVVLVDCGYPGFMPLMEAAMQLHQLSLNQLTGIIITHADIDHVGSLYEIKEAYPDVKVYSSAIEAAQVDGREKSSRLLQAEAMLETLPEDKQAGALQFISMLRSVQPVPVNAVLKPEEEIPFLPGVQVIAMPGHTPGHISLYVKENKTLIAADAVVVENGELEIANPQFTLDMEAAIESLRKMAILDIEKLICYHGGVFDKDIKAQLRKLIVKYEHR